MELNRRLTERPQAMGGELRSPAFIILHIVTHAFHHKGQVAAMLRTLGYPAPDTDLQKSVEIPCLVFIPQLHNSTL